ncbi:hypothetical protein CDL15_Pgr020904 [Punica granatum]|uniref:Uncharacterized protein n=1 Tax=Punica granatum TaxID=22663 RepID=A0A218XVT2_PUNGR|nr:hypothetical protein CDL15_Pgr020904 [Punica granatum]
MAFFSLNFLARRELSRNHRGKKKEDPYPNGQRSRRGAGAGLSQEAATARRPRRAGAGEEGRRQGKMRASVLSDARGSENRRLGANSITTNEFSSKQPSTSTPRPRRPSGFRRIVGLLIDERIPEIRHSQKPSSNDILDTSNALLG